LNEIVYNFFQTYICNYELSIKTYWIFNVPIELSHNMHIMFIWLDL